MAILLCGCVAPVVLIGRCEKEVAKAGETQVSTQRPARFFSVRDSIEMSRFDTTDGGPLFSPDDKFFVVVTSRGFIETDSIESTLWVFQTSEIRHFLESTKTTEPFGRPLVKLNKIPRNNYTIFYAPTISNVRWQEDSKALLFLGQDSPRENHLYRVDIETGTVRELTPKGYDVSQYQVQGDTIAYLVAPIDQNVPIGTIINADALDVTGETLAAFMPQIDESVLFRELWVMRNGEEWPIRGSGTQPVHLANHFPDVLAVSPDQQSVAVLQPSEGIPSLWEAYQPAFDYLRLHADDPGITGRFNLERPMQYVVFDAKSGKPRYVLRAPQGNGLGYIQGNVALWSADNKRLLVTNTFLPLEHVDETERVRRLRPCACAMIDLEMNSASCVAFGQYDRPSDSRLVSANFGRNSDEVIVAFSNSSTGEVHERYRRLGSVWSRLGLAGSDDVEAHRDQNQPTGGIRPITIEIREDPNTPAALYAVAPDVGKSRKIFDPNPALPSFNLGEIAPFNWTDKTGYKWKGQLVKPPDYIPGERYPLVIQTYGFSSGFVSDGLFPTASAVRALAAVGIMVLQMPRRADHYGTAREAQDQVMGFEAAIEGLTSDGLIDPERVGIVGFSHTCYHVESALIGDPGLFAAATIADGMDGSYLQYLYSAGDPTARLSEEIYGAKPFGTGLKTWVDRAPGFNLHKVQTPLRIEAIGFPSILGEWETYASLRSQGKAVDLVYLPFGDHLLQKPLERMASQQGNVDWFRFWLKGEEDSDPAKRKQYARWRKMRAQMQSKGRS